MVLFSSFSHFNILLLFTYMGLVSGLVFFLVFNISKKIKSKNNRAVKNLIEIKKKCKQHSSKYFSTKQETIVEKFGKDIDTNKKAKEKKQKGHKKNKSQKKERKTRIRLALIKARQNIILIFKRTQNILLTIICVVVLVAVVLGSYYLNFVFNYGYLRLVFIAVWITSFFIGGYVQKKVAKLLATFYNKTCKRKFGLKS